MTIIEASTVKCSTLVDGTLRVVLDIEPRHAQAAFQLFGAPGRAVAIAGLKDGASALTTAPLPAPPEPADPMPAPKPKAPAEPSKRSVEVAQAKAERWHAKGPLERAAITLCKLAEFQQWIGADNEPDAVSRLYCVVGVTTRAGLDDNTVAATMFRARVLEPWREYQARNGNEVHA